MYTTNEYFVVYIFIFFISCFIHQLTTYIRIYSGKSIITHQQAIDNKRSMQFDKMKLAPINSISFDTHL